MLKLAGHTLGTPEQTVPEALALFAAAGLDAAEVIWQDDYRSGIPENDGEQVLRDLAAAKRSTGVEVYGLTPYMSGINSLAETERQRDLQRFRHCIADAEQLGAKVVRVYAGSYTSEEVADRAAKWDRLVTSLRELAPEAESAGVTLVVENHFNTMTMSARESAALMRAVDHPAVGILYDQANLTFTHCEAFPEAVRLQKSWIRHVHVKDLVFTDPERAFSASSVATVAAESRAVRSRVIGDGVLEWGAILAALMAAGYTGALSLEYEYRWHPQDLPDPSTGFRRGADRLRQLLTEVSS